LLKSDRSTTRRQKKVLRFEFVGAGFHERQPNGLANKFVVYSKKFNNKTRPYRVLS
jgi:hypothetical protein